MLREPKLIAVVRRYGRGDSHFGRQAAAIAEATNLPLLTVLWVLGLLTTVSLSLLWDSNVSYRLSRNDCDAAILNAIADGAVDYAVSDLFDQQSDRLWRQDEVHLLKLAGAKVRIMVQDELGKIDINQADPALLSSLLRSTGLDADAAADLADKIADWRTTTELKHLNGAKEFDYRAANSSSRPRNGPFQSVDELLLVMDMTPALFRRIEPAVTVYSGSQFVDPRHATPEALAALPEVIRKQGTASEAPPAFPIGGNDNQTSSLSGRAFTIRIAIEKSDQVARYQVVVRMTDNPARPYFLLSWKRA
ncbi:putative General secretion pathway protein K [Bradyrhizobium sp. STM 3843]|uniref:general secretion pathway protein GspK n=1 Tax=Bradyrhizobium sp. STM 3843 TaxID=551947 RepID=UPI00024037C2|nr:type II secretion system protein GspK [Bradyrhizobium sp. STM 3843]CCE08434.1 putative General secretion pathway protein K [Bradyrhizobium sp. STM 3843]